MKTLNTASPLRGNPWRTGHQKVMEEGIWFQEPVHCVSGECAWMREQKAGGSAPAPPRPPWVTGRGVPRGQAAPSRARGHAAGLTGR